MYYILFLVSLFLILTPFLRHCISTYAFKHPSSCICLAGIYLFKINNENTRTMCEIYSELIPERRQGYLYC